MDSEPPSPMPPQVFLHFLEKTTDAHAEATWTSRFLHKVNDSFYSCAEPLAVGWGIHIEEGRNWLLYCTLNFIVLLSSGGVAALYAVLQTDTPTGVAIGTWLTAVQGIVVAIVFFFLH